MSKLIIRQLGTMPYQNTLREMKKFTESRNQETQDELWLLEHFPVFTQGQAGKAEHVLNAKNIPVFQSDRGGQVTYHGPGQLIAYTLFDVKRLKLTVRALVRALEQSIIDLLAQHNQVATSDCNAPGVYVNGAKICSVGLRIKRGCSYHGLALNVDMDLSPFQQINPCGFANLSVTQCKDLAITIDMPTISQQVASHIAYKLGYNDIQHHYNPLQSARKK